jgi:hypothetical protein
MNAVHRFAVRHPRVVLAIAALAIALCAPGILRLRLRTDGNALVPEEAAAVRLDREVRRQFAVTDPVIVLVRAVHPDGIYHPATLRLVADLSDSLARLPQVASVRSLATERADRFRPGTLEIRTLLDPVPRTRPQIEELRSDVAAIGWLEGTLVSTDGAAAAIYVGVPSGADRTSLLDALHRTVARADTSRHSVAVVGAPAAETLLGMHVLEDLGLPVGARRAASLARVPDADPGWLGRIRLGVARHLGLLPLSFAAMALVFLLTFRGLAAMWLPLSEAGACLVFVFGVMGWAGVPVYLTMAVLPVILVSMGLADEIHVFTRHRQRRTERPGEAAADSVRATLDETGLPVIATALTTAFGFLSFALSPLPPVRAFGLFTAMGILFCLVWTLTVIPALLVLLAGHGRGVGAGAPPAGVLPEGGAGGRPAGGLAALEDRSSVQRPVWSDRLARLSRRPWWTLGIAAALVAGGIPGLRRLVVQDSWNAGFAPESAFRRDTEDFNRRFHGAHRLLLALDTGHLEERGFLQAADLGFDRLRLPGDVASDPQLLLGCAISVGRVGAPPGQRWTSVIVGAERRDGRILAATPPVHGSPGFLFSPGAADTFEFSVRSQRLALPDVLGRIAHLEDFVRGQTGLTVGGVIGPPDLIATAEHLTSHRAPGSRRIPGNPDRVRWLWSTMERVQGSERLREIVDPGLDRGLVTVFLKDANYRDTARLMAALRDYEREQLAPERIRLEFAGDVAVSQALIEAIVRSQIASLLGSLAGIFVMAALLFRSAVWGLACMVPATLSVAATFAVMGWASIPIGVATSMFAAMVLGVGVDFAIHLASRYRSAVAGGMDGDSAIQHALAVTGPAIVVNGLAVSLGMGLLVLSRVPSNARLGAITVVSLLACLAATLLVVPALLRIAGKRGK